MTQSGSGFATQLGHFLSVSESDSTSIGTPTFGTPVDTTFDHEHGVRWRGPWPEEFDSTGIATRLHMRALHTAGVPISAIGSSPEITTKFGDRGPALWEHISDLVIAEVGHLVEREEKKRFFRSPVALIDHVVPSLERVRNIVFPGRSFEFDQESAIKIAKARVLYSVWERDRISAQMAGLLSHLGDNWVPCRRNARALADAGVPNVGVIPHPFDPTSPLPQIGENKKSPTGDVIFYSIAKWEPRKGLHELIGAFLQEFSPSREKAVLGIKTDEKIRWKGYSPHPTASLAHWAEDEDVKAKGWTAESIRQRVRIVTNKLPVQGIWKMHHAGHVYVSASHGEAWDLPAFDATLARSRLIHVGFGGSEDYAASNAIRVWPGQGVPLFGRTLGELADGPKEPAHAAYRWPTTEWAVLDVALLRAALRRAYEDREVGDAQDLAPWTMETVGRQMKERLVALADRNGVGVKW